MASKLPVSQRVGIIDAAKLVDDAGRMLDVDKFDPLVMAAALWRIVDAAGMLADLLRGAAAAGSQRDNPTAAGFFIEWRQPIDETISTFRNFSRATAPFTKADTEAPQ